MSRLISEEEEKWENNGKKMENSLKK